MNDTYVKGAEKEKKVLLKQNIFFIKKEKCLGNLIAMRVGIRMPRVEKKRQKVISVY